MQLSAVLLKIWLKGRRDRLGQKKAYVFSGVNILVSDRAFSEVEGQIEDALTFLHTFASELCLLATFLETEDIVLDFDINDRDVIAQADLFPQELLQRMGEFQIGLVVSRYSRDEGDSSASDTASNS